MLSRANYDESVYFCHELLKFTKNFKNSSKFVAKQMQFCMSFAIVQSIQLFHMYILLISIVIGIFIAMLFLNIYFRVKVFQVYGRLVRARVEFGAAHIFNSEKMATEILPRYPEQREDILLFVRHIHYSIRMASVLTGLITLFGGILMWYRHE